MALLDASRKFLSRQDGNVAVMFALCSVPLLAFTGAAIDYGFAIRLQGKLQAADDATALALCQTPNNTLTPALQKQAETSMGGYMQNTSLKVDALTIVPSSPGVARQITLTSHITSGTYLSGFTSVVSPSVVATSQCSTPVPKNFEIALVLDNTGSMVNSSNNQTKLQALQKAANYFIEYVYSNAAFSDSTKISIVPFAGAVTVKNPRSLTDYTPNNTNWIDWTGKSSYHWKNINQKLTTTGNTINLNNRNDIFGQLASLNPATYSTTPYAYYDWNWGGCIETPPYPQNVNDTKPDTTNPDTLYQQYFAPDEPGPGTTDQNGYYGVTYSDKTNKNNVISNSVWNDYIPDSNCQNQTSQEYRSAESRGCKYASATAANIAARKTTMIGAIDLGQNGPNWGCTSAPLQRLLVLRSGTNKATLESLINNMSPRGSTNIHEGFMWGWRTISPNSVFSADTASYNTASTQPTDATSKVIIMMTDGMNDWLNLLGNSATTGNGGLYNALGYPTNSNTSDAAGTSANARLQTNPNHQTPVIENGYSNIYDSSSNSGRSAIDGLFTEACSNAKLSANPGDPPKVSVYTIAFSIPGDAIDSNGQTMLKNCASSADQYFLANDSNGLIAAFAKIASSIGALRISQ